MGKTNVLSRFGGRNNGIPDDDALLHEGGVLPKDFPQRLERLKEASGLSWDALARAIGVNRKSLIRWLKKGVEPCGGAMHAIFRFAARMPGVLEIAHGRGPPDEPLQGMNAAPRPRRLGTSAARRGRIRLPRWGIAG